MFNINNQAIYAKFIWEVLRDYSNTKTDDNCFNCKYRKIDKILNGSVCGESKYNTDNKAEFHRAYKHKFCNKYVRKEIKNGI